MSSWFDLRYRSGDILSARIRDLIQKQIDAQSEVTDVTDEQVIQPIIPLASKTVWRDHLFRAKLRNVTAGQIAKLPIDPDGKEMRLWFYNEHGGRFLTDSSFQGNLGELMGSDQSKLLDNTDDDGISVTRNVNWLVGDQHIRVHDNPNVQLKNIHQIETGFTIFLRVFIPFLNNEVQYLKRGVLFSKLDDEQVKFGYVCQIDDNGNAYFIVRDDSREYSITALDLFPDLINNLVPDFNSKDFNSLDFLAVATLENLIPPIIPYVDLAFTYEFATHRMQIIKNGVVFKDSNSDPEATGLVGAWKLVEGGDIGNTPDEPTTFTRTVYNSIETGTNGTISASPTWTNDIAEHETYLKFSSTAGAAQTVTIPNYTNIQTFSALTISLWYRPISNPAGSDIVELVKKNFDNNGTFSLFQDSSDVFSSYVKNDAGVSETVASSTGAVSTLNEWYHLVLRWTAGGKVKINVDDVKTESINTLAGNVSTGTTDLIIGSSTLTAEPDGYPHDVKIWNRELSDVEVTSLFDAGHPHAGFPKWEENPPPPPEIPEPITNPFKLEYDVPLPPIDGGREWIKLHKLVASGFTQVYSEGDGVTIPEETIPFSTVYEVTDASGGWEGGGGGGGTPSTVYNVTTGSSGQHLEFEGGVSRAGIKFNSGNAHLGKVITRVVVQFRKQNSPSGTATVTIRSNGGTLRATLGTFSPGGFGSGEQTVSINSSSSYQMVADDVVSVEYPSGSNTIELTEIDPSGPNNVSGFTSVVSTGGSFSNNSRLLTMVIDAATAGGGGGGGTGYPLYAVSSRSGGSDCNQGNWLVNDITHVGALITSSSADMHGEVLSRITVKLSKVGSPPGNVEVSVRSGDIAGSGVGIDVWGTVSAGTLTGTPTDYTFTKLSNTDVMGTNQSVVCRATHSGGDENNHFVVHASGSSQEAGVNLRYRVWNEQDLCWEWPFGGSAAYVTKNNTSQDVTGKFETGGQVTPAKLHYYELNGGAIREVGELLISSSSPLSGKKITRVKPKLKAVGNPTGTIRCIIRNGSGQEVGQLGSIEANTVSPTAFEEKEFTNILQSRTLTSSGGGDRVMIQYTGTSSAYIQIMIKHDEGAATGGDKVVTLSSGGNFTEVDADLSGTIFVGGTATDPDAYERVGEKADLATSQLKLKKISKVLVWLRKVGNPPNQVFCRIRRQLDDITVTNIGEINTSSLLATGTEKGFIRSPVSVYAVQQDDTILIEYPDGDDNNYVEVLATNSDSIDSNRSILVGFDALFTNYDSFPNKDLVAEMYSGGDTFTPTGDEIPPPPPPAYTHDLHISAGGYPYTYYTDITTIENWIGTIAPDIRWYRKILTTNELLNIFQNRRDRSNLPLGQVAVVGYFSLASTV